MSSGCSSVLLDSDYTQGMRLPTVGSEAIIQASGRSEGAAW